LRILILFVIAAVVPGSGADRFTLGSFLFPSGPMEQWTAEGFAEAYEAGAELGLGLTHIHVDWGESEPVAGSYDWGSFDSGLRLAAGQGMRVSVVIPLVDITELGELPADIEFDGFDDPKLRNQFVDFVRRAVARNPLGVDYLWIGNEIDEYFRQHRDQFPAYATLFREVRDAVHAEFPHIQVGAISTYHDAKKNGSLDIATTIGEYADVLGFTLYPEMLGLEPQDSAGLFDEIGALAKRAGKQFCLVETGWSTGGPLGSLARQERYIRVLAHAYELHRRRIGFVNWFALYDLSGVFLEPFQQAPKDLLDWLSSLGLAKANGSRKRSWGVFASEVAHLLNEPYRRGGVRPPAGTRPFLLAMTPNPHVFTQQGVDAAYAITDQHTDMIAHHFDSGVPWPEALAGSPYDQRVEAEINERVARRRPGQRVYVSVAPLQFDRRTMAGYWGAGPSHDERPGVWRDRTLDHPDAIRAYVNFCRDLIGRLHPDFFNYGVEVGGNWEGEDDPDLQRFLVFAKAVYTTLKREYPDLPIFVSLMKSRVLESAERVRINRKLLEYSDYVTVSTYPYFTPELQPKNADPSELARDWLSSMRRLDPSKPFAIAETGYIAEDLTIPAIGASVHGTPQWQRDYLEWLLSEAARYPMEFVIWFVPRDYDEASAWMHQVGGFPPWFDLWRDTGMVDGAGNPRPSLALWDEWLGMSYRKRPARTIPSIPRLGVRR